MVGALLKLLLVRVNVPYTVGLFVIGLAIGTMNHYGVFDARPIIGQSIDMACALDPDLILNIFLPILIFSAAYELDIHIFRKTLTNATLLSIPGMIIAMVLTAALMMGITHFAPSYANWNWTFALMFGALISATDPVAVVALLGELSVSKRFSTLIDGESMLNDGTGIVLFMLMYAPFTMSVSSPDSSPVISFLTVVVGGIVIGYLLARLFVFFITQRGVRNDMMLQTASMILLSYLTFILAQDIFELSGVIALVTFGLALAYHGVDKLDEKTRDFMKEFWGLLAYIANTLIFVIIGIIIADKVVFTWHDLIVLFLVYIGVNIVRMVMILTLYPLLKRSGYGLSKREAVILSWGALRGAVGLTLALMVTYTDTIPEDVSRQILLLTAGIVTLTLVINATTIKWFLRKLGMLRSSAARELMRANVHNTIHQRSAGYLAQLKDDPSMLQTNWAEVEEQLHEQLHMDMETPDREDLLSNARLQILSFERQAVWSLYKSGAIAIEAQRKLIDILDGMVDSEGHRGLDERLEELGVSDNYKIPSHQLLRRNKWLRYAIFYLQFKSPTYRYEVAYGAMVANQKMVESLNTLLASDTIKEEQREHLSALCAEVDSVIGACQSYIDNFAQRMPEEYSAALTIRAKRMMSQFERDCIESLVQEGMIDQEVAEELIAERS